jgi:hypothetical protein
VAVGVAAERRGLERWAAVGGVLYVVLFVVGAIVSYAGQPDTGSPPAKLIAYYSDSGHRHRINIGWLIVIFSIFFFIWFLGALRIAVRRLDGDGLLLGVAGIGGAVYAACTLVGISVNAGIKTMSDDTYRHTVYPELIHAADDAGYIIHAAGGAGIGAMIVAVSLALLRARAAPAWACWLSVLAGVAAILSILFFPWFVIAIWILIASGLLLRAQGTATAPPPAV